MNFEDLVINLGISAILTVVKNPAKAAHLKAALLKVRNAINACFPGE